MLKTDLLLSGQSEPSGMAARVAAFDWATTSLGPIEQWPESLRTAVGICLNSHFPMFVWWGEELIHIYNDAYAVHLGKRHPEALGMPARDIWQEIWHFLKEDVETVMVKGKSVFRERHRIMLERNGYPEETFYTYADSPIPDGKGGIGGFMQVCYGETATVNPERAREQTRLQLEAERANLASIIERAPAFIVMLRGPKHVVEFSNEMYYQLIGRRDIISKTLLEALPEIENQGFIELLDSVYRTGEPHVGKEVLVLLGTPEATQKHYVSFVYQALRGANGEVTGIFVHGVDVTDAVRSREVIQASEAQFRQLASEREQLLAAEQAARAQAEQAARMKDEFLATLSHEIRTPLNAILGWTQIMQRSKDPEDIASGLEVIERNARAQSQIIEDLLDMSRIISGKVRLDVQRLNLSGIVQAAVETARPTAEAKGVRLKSIIDPLHGVAISGDANRLQQILWNLISNAIKFTPREGQVQVLLERVNSHLEISVIDTGEGIKPEFLPFVFDRFRQADASTTRRHGGLGLGLSIVKQLVELHGGAVRVKSAGVGKGATFVVSLPLVVMHAEPEPERRHPRASAELSGMASKGGDVRGVRCLVIDDEGDARALVKRLLEDSHAIVTATDSASEVLELVKSKAFDVLISDIGMPGEDGYSLIRRVRRLGKANGGDIPAIALTAYARAEDRVKAVSAGFLMHLAKPVEPVELLTMVAAAAGRTGGE